MFTSSLQSLLGLVDQHPDLYMLLLQLCSSFAACCMECDLVQYFVVG